MKRPTSAQEALTFARQKAQECETWMEFNNAMFGIGGKFGELFPTQAEREQFRQSDEYAEIAKLMDNFPGSLLARGRT